MTEHENFYYAQSPKGDKREMLEKDNAQMLSDAMDFGVLEGPSLEEVGGSSYYKRPTPFVKWVGGKRNLVHSILQNFPKKFNDYYEPFVGGGAVFFSISDRIRNAIISDNNLELILTYKTIQKNPQQLIELLKVHQKNHSKDYYYKMRSLELTKPIEIAARFIYLNKTCYNGLYRVNKKGKFNVPMGRYKNPNIVQQENILACRNALQTVNILYGDFERIKPREGDFIYCDPPYHPTNEISFTEYTQQNFTEAEQARLRDYITDLTKHGVYVMLSNSNTKFILDLYKSKSFYKKVVYAPRYVNCKPGSRGDVEELIITNYPSDISCDKEPAQTILVDNCQK